MAQTHSLDLERSSSQYASITDASQTGLDVNATWTIETWVNLESLPTSGQIYSLINKWAGAGTRSYLLWYQNSAGTLRFTVANSSNGTNESFSDLNFSCATGVWYHVATESAVVAAVSIKQDHSENLDDWAVKGCPEGDIATHDGEETFSNKVYSGAVFSDTARFSEVSNGNSGTSKTVDFSAGNKQNLTLTGNCTLTFTSPASPCSLVFKLVQDGTGGRTVVWPSSVKWSGGTAPTLTTGAGKVDLVAFYFDGTNYFGTSSLNYTV